VPSGRCPPGPTLLSEFQAQPDDKKGEWLLINQTHALQAISFLINSTAGVGGLYDPARDVWHITKSPCALSLGDARLDRGSWARQRGRRPNAATTFGSVAKSCSVRASAASITSRATSLASASASRRLVPP